VASALLFQTVAIKSQAILHHQRERKSAISIFQSVHSESHSNLCLRRHACRARGTPCLIALPPLSIQRGSFQLLPDCKTHSHSSTTFAYSFPLLGSKRAAWRRTKRMSGGLTTAHMRGTALRSCWHCVQVGSTIYNSAKRKDCLTNNNNVHRQQLKTAASQL
jgi:hypothetical protein